MERLIIIIDPMIHGATAMMESMMGTMEDGEESRFLDSSGQNVEHGGDLARQEGINMGKEPFEMEEEKVTITLKEVKVDRGVDRHLEGLGEGIDEGGGGEWRWEKRSTRLRRACSARGRKVMVKWLLKGMKGVQARA